MFRLQFFCGRHVFFIYAALQTLGGNTALAEPKSIALRPHYTYQFTGSPSAFQLMNSITPPNERTLHIGVESDHGDVFYDTAVAVDSIAPAEEQKFASLEGTIRLPGEFAVLYGQRAIAIALRDGRTVIDKIPKEFLITNVALTTFHRGKVGVIRAYVKRPGKETVASLRAGYIISNNQIYKIKQDSFEALKQRFSELGRQTGRGGLVDDKLLKIFSEELKFALEHKVEPANFTREGMLGFEKFTDTRPVPPGKILPMVGVTFKAELAPLALTAPEQANVALSKETARPPYRQLTPLPDLKVTNENGQTQSAEELIRSFARDMIKDAYELNWPYDENPKLRAIEDRVIANLLKPEAGSVAILGAPGVGKDMLFQRIAVRFLRTDNIPTELLDVHLWSFDAAGLQAGTSLRGTSEARANAINMLGLTGRIIFSVSEVHTLKGSGTSSNNANDVLEQVKPALARGMRWLVNDTPDDWNRAFGSDNAIKRRFTEVDLPEPKGEDLLQMLRAWWAWHGRGQMPEAALEQVQRLSDLYAPNGAQPSRATTLMSDIKVARGIANQDGPVTTREVLEAAIVRYRIPNSEFDPVLRQKAYDRLAALLDERLVGNTEAKKIILQQERVVLSGSQDLRRPRRRFILIGPAGTGKSETAEIIREAHGRENNAHFMMNQYSHPAQAPAFARAIADAVTKDPFADLFFDEIEKGAVECQTVALRLMESGELTVTHEDGRTTLLRAHNASVIMATNAAEDYIMRLADNSSGIGFETGTRNSTAPAMIAKQNESDLRRALKKDGLNSYLLDRMDELVAYYPPTPREFRSVVAMHLRKAILDMSVNTMRKIEIENIDEMATQLAAENWRPRMSNRDAVRIISRTIRYAAANVHFEAEQRSLAAGGDGRVGDLRLAWRGSELGESTEPPAAVARVMDQCTGFSAGAAAR